MSDPDRTIAATRRREARDLLHELCERAGITRANRHDKLFEYVKQKLDEAREGDPLCQLRGGAPSSEALKKDLVYGVPQRPISATELRVRILDLALNAGGHYIAICQAYWNALRPPQPGTREIWYQITFPEVDPVQGPVGRLFTAIDVTEVEVHGEDFSIEFRRIAPEDPGSFGLRWRGTGVEREGHRFLTFASLDPIRNRSIGSTALRRVGNPREEYYDGYYFRPGDPAASQPFQLERRRVAWYKSPPLGAWPRVALIDWDNTLHPGWTLIPWCEFLENECLIPEGNAVAQKIKTLLSGYPKEQTHDELAAQSSELYANAISSSPAPSISEAAHRFVTNRSRFHPYRWVDPFLRGLVNLGIAPIIVSGAPADVLAAWAFSRKEMIAGCYGLQAPNATSAALPNPFLSGVVPGQVNPATADGKQHLVDQLRRTKRSLVLALGDSASDSPLWEAADYGIYMGAIVKPVKDSRQTLIVERPQDIEHDVLISWVQEQIGIWDEADWMELA